MLMMERRQLIAAHSPGLALGVVDVGFVPAVRHERDAHNPH